MATTGEKEELKNKIQKERLNQKKTQKLPPEGWKRLGEWKELLGTGSMK